MLSPAPRRFLHNRRSVHTDSVIHYTTNLVGLSMLKRKFSTVITLLLCLSLLLGMAVPAAADAAGSAGSAGYTLPEEKVVYSDTALLVSLGSSAENDVVLYDKAADEVRAPGAMIRYMVVAYALRRMQETGMDIDTATGTYTLDMFNHYVAGTGVPTANMAYGETWTVRDLLSAAFLQSASDAVTTLAFAIDGGVNPFVEGMNALAKELQCDYTHFANITGLDSLSQYTTARDVYRIIRYAQTFSQFEDLVSKRQITVQPVSGGQSHTLVSVNHMQQASSQFYYSPLVFSRTGLSDHEGRTCASVARDSGYEYLVVVMSCPEKNSAGESGLHYRDTRTLFRWAFNSFSYTTLLAKSEILASVRVGLSWSTDRLNLVPEREFATVVDSKLEPDQIIKKVTLDKEQVVAPIEKGTVLGKVELIINVDQKISEVPLVASESISRNWLLYAWSGVAGFFTSIWFLLGVGLLILLLVGYAILNVVSNRRRRQERLGRVHDRKPR